LKNNNRYRFVILLNVILVRSCVGLLWASAGPLLPLIIEEFGITRSTAGWFASVAPLTIAVVSLPISAIGSRISLKKTFAIGALLQGLGILAFFSPSYFPLLLLRVCFAVGTAVTVPVATAITAEWFSNRELPIINGITLSFVNLGNGVAFAATIPIAIAISWSAPIGIYSSFALTCALAWVIFGREKVKEPVSSQHRLSSVLDDRPDLSFKQIITNRHAILLTISVTVSWALGNVIGAWLPDYYYTVFNIPLQKASSIMVAATVGGTAACITGGILSTRLGRRKPFLIISGLFTGLSALFAVLFNSSAVIYASVAMFGVFGAIHVSSLFTIPMEIPGMSLRSGVIVISMMQVGGNLGNFISPLVMGYLVDITGSYLPGFIAFVIISFGAMATGLLLPETGPGAKKSPTKEISAVR
jgi:MFS family permease